MSLTALVIGVGGLHLIWRAAAYLGIQTGRPGTTKKGVRSDWYMFFHRSRLIGDTREESVAEERQVTPAPRPQVDRRPRARF